MKSTKSCWAKLPASLCASAALAASSLLASTCIVSYPAGDMDPKSTMSSASVAVDAGAGAVALLQSWLEARFMTFDASPGMALTTLPLGIAVFIN